MNKQQNAGTPDSLEYTTQQRIDFLATLIVEQVQHFLDTGEMPPEITEQCDVFADQFQAA